MAVNTLLEVKNLTAGYGKKIILDHLDMNLSSNRVTVLLGGNGAGKTTLMKSIGGILEDRQGQILFEDQDLMFHSRKEYAKKLCYISSEFRLLFDYTVLDFVLLGRIVHASLMATPSSEDIEKAMAALDQLGIADFAKRHVTALSTGERQLVLLARALVQDAQLMVLDELTGNLDFANSYKVMNIIKQLAASGKTILISVHDPNLAMEFADDIITMSRGHILNHLYREQPDYYEQLECNLIKIYGLGIKLYQTQGKTFIGQKS